MTIFNIATIIIVNVFIVYVIIITAIFIITMFIVCDQNYDNQENHHHNFVALSDNHVSSNWWCLVKECSRIILYECSRLILLESTSSFKHPQLNSQCYNVYACILHRCVCIFISLLIYQSTNQKVFVQAYLQTSVSTLKQTQLYTKEKHRRGDYAVYET